MKLDHVVYFTDKSTNGNRGGTDKRVGRHAVSVVAMKNGERIMRCFIRRMLILNGCLWRK